MLLCPERGFGLDATAAEIVALCNGTLAVRGYQGSGRLRTAARCQAFALTGEAAATAPACALSPHHALVTSALEHTGDNPRALPIYRGMRKSAGAPDLIRGSTRPKALAFGRPGYTYWTCDRYSQAS